MSFYATLNGTVTCHDKSAFTTILTRLELGGWIVNEQFVNEDGEPVDDEKHVDHKHLQLTIPRAVYRNLTRVNFFEHPTTNGWIWGSSTDGVELCWIDGPPKTMIPELPLTLFGDDEDKPDPDEDMDAYIDWQVEAADTFHGESYSDIQKIAEKHFGQVYLCAEGVDELLLRRQTATLVRLQAAAKDDVTKEHLEGLLNLLSQLRP